jgi:molecular chaperone HtpG
MAKGNIGVTTENIFPVIKKFLYSDHEIFLREMVSNAVDATQKLKTLAQQGDFKGELGSTAVSIKLNKEEGTLTFSDHGIGMTEEEIDRYINQIAFSGVTDFLDKYKENANAIIGHFGLGFYSAFMVADKVEIITKSYKENAQVVKWTCDGSPEYEIETLDGSDWRKDSANNDHGSDIVLHISEDCKEFLEEYKIKELLNKYCKFMAVPVIMGKKQEWDKDAKAMKDTDEDYVINSIEPLWTKQPAGIKDEEYKEFYKSLYPMSDEPLFWIHLNVDFPFHLTGILYFPRVQSNMDLQRNKIQLYCNQVFVTDQVEGIVPEFLTLLHGVIDSPDIPLNVSRSYLQSDSNVKKIATYITKKVADRLNSIFKSDRADYEKKWDDLKIFINFGMLTDESFFDRAKDFALLKDTEGKYFTFEEYKTLITSEQTDKDGNLIYLYANDKDEQYTYIEAAKAKGYSVLMMDGQLDTSTVSMFEQKFEKTRFTRVDADILERLIVKEDAKKVDLSKEDTDKLTEAFKGKLPTMDKATFNVEIQALGEDAAPVMFTQNEYMRRMKDISKYQSGMAFYSQMPDSYNLVLNADNALIKGVLADTEGKGDTISQLIDLALLQNGMLKGEALDKFLKRSVDLLK